MKFFAACQSLITGLLANGCAKGGKGNWGGGILRPLCLAVKMAGVNSLSASEILHQGSGSQSLVSKWLAAGLLFASSCSSGDWFWQWRGFRRIFFKALKLAGTRSSGRYPPDQTNRSQNPNPALSPAFPPKRCNAKTPSLSFPRANIILLHSSALPSKCIATQNASFKETAEPSNRAESSKRKPLPILLLATPNDSLATQIGYLLAFLAGKR